VGAFQARDKARPSGPRITIGAGVRVRRDRIDKGGKLTLRHRTRLHHIGVGHAHKGKRVIMLIDGLDVRVLSEDGGAAAAAHARPHEELPAQGMRGVYDVPRHVGTMSRDITQCPPGGIEPPHAVWRTAARLARDTGNVIATTSRRGKQAAEKGFPPLCDYKHSSGRKAIAASDRSAQAWRESSLLPGGESLNKGESSEDAAPASVGPPCGRDSRRPRSITLGTVWHFTYSYPTENPSAASPPLNLTRCHADAVS
jgi:hypothetical protein